MNGKMTGQKDNWLSSYHQVPSQYWKVAKKSEEIVCLQGYLVQYYHSASAVHELLPSLRLFLSFILSG